MYLKNLLVGTFAIVALAGCSSGNSAEGNRVTAAEAPAMVESAADYTPGVANYTFNVSPGPLLVDGAMVEEVMPDTFEGYPTLASHVADLSAADRAIETKEQALEIYAGDSLAMAIDLRGEAPSVLWSKNGFMAENIMYTKVDSEQGQGMTTGTVAFDLRECLVPEEKEEEQGQEQEQGEEKGEEEKGAEQEQGQDQEQGEEQDKGEEKVEEEKAAEVCRTVSYTLNLEEIAAPKEEEKVEEEQGQDQEQGKEEEEKVEEGQDDEKGQGQEEDKGQEQDEEKGQEENK